MALTYQKEIFDMIATAYGYDPIESANHIMWSYSHQERGERINYYYTTGTVTVQFKTKKLPRTVKHVLSDVDFEAILINNK